MNPRPSASAARRLSSRHLLPALLLMLGVTGTPAETPFVNDPEMAPPASIREGRKWTEDRVTLPPWPRDRDLVEVKLDGPSRALRHFIDTRSLSTGNDGVVRYTLVSKSAGGAENVTFQGLRCTPNGRYKVYAYGSGGRFEPTRIQEDWLAIAPRGGDPLYRELWRHYLCVHRQFEPRPRKDQIRMLKSGRVPDVENAGFLSE